MSNRVQHLRAIGKVTSPPASAGVEGMIALGFPGVAGDSTKPTIWAHDGTAWRESNPSVTITTQSITLPAGADIGAAYALWAGTTTNKITGSVVIATFGSPPQAYVLTNAAAPGVATSWTSLGGAVSFANETEITTGTEATKATNSAGLRSASRSAPTGGSAPNAGDANHFVLLQTGGTINPLFIPQPAPAGAGGVGGDVATVVAGIATNMFLTPAGLAMRVVKTPDATTPANDANKLPALDATGKIPAGFLPAGGLTFAGMLNLTTPYSAPTTAPKAGDLFTVAATGTVDASWVAKLSTLTAGAPVNAGDMLIWDATAGKFHHIANTVDMTAYLPLSGTTTAKKMAAAAVVAFNTPATAGLVTRIDGGDVTKSALDSFTIDCGSY